MKHTTMNDRLDVERLRELYSGYTCRKGTEAYAELCGILDSARDTDLVQLSGAGLGQISSLSAIVLMGRKHFPWNARP